MPRKFGELVTHYTKNELPNKSPYAQDVYNGYLSKWITPKWQGYNLYKIHSVEVEHWLGTLKSLANGTRAELRNIMCAILLRDGQVRTPDAKQVGTNGKRAVAEIGVLQQ